MVAAYFILFNQKKININGEPLYLFSFPNEKFDAEESLKNPLNIAIYQEIIAVTSSSSSSVKFFDTNGNFLNKINLGKDFYPTGLTFDAKGTMYVCSKDKGIYGYPDLMSSNGRFRVNLSGINPISLGANNLNLYIFNTFNREVLIVPLSSVKSRKIKVKGFGEFSYANGLLAYKNLVYVADSNNGKVQVFYNNGKLKEEINRKFSLPRGLALDSLGRLHLVETFSGKVRVFKGNHELYSYGQTDGTAKLSYPNSIALNKDRIYIADRANHRIAVYGWQNDN